MIIMAYPEEPFLVAIGKIAIRHGQLDYSLKMTVRTLAGISITEAVDATDRQSSSALRDRVHKLARKRFGESVTSRPPRRTPHAGEDGNRATPCRLTFFCLCWRIFPLHVPRHILMPHA